MKRGIWIALMLSLVAQASTAMKVRNLKPGDPLPQGEQVQPLLLEQDRVILFVNSSAEKTLRFLEIAGPAIREANTGLLVVDTADNTTDACRELAARFGGTVVSDADKTLYGVVGVIVLPTALFVRADHVLNSTLAGVRPNLEAYVRSHLNALKNRTNPGDPFAQAGEKQAARRMSRELTQAFNMLKTGAAELARTIYEKILKDRPDHVDALLGAGYGCIEMDDPDAAIGYFKKLVQKDDNPRYRFGLSLATYEKSQSPEDLTAIRETVRFEPDFFMVVARAATLLDKAGDREGAAMAWRHAYRVLWKSCRRKK